MVAVTPLSDAPSPAAAPAAAAKASRDLRLDFFRGLALFLIFIDHIPGNVLSHFTLPAIGFSDAAEVFIFISGYTAAMVYGRTLMRLGPLFATAQVYRRVWQLYVAHVFLFVIYTAEVSYSVLTFNNSMYNDESRVGDFLAEPHIAIIKALLLQFQPQFLDILPLYIVLLASFPLILLLLRVHWLAAVLPSAALYLAVHLFELSVRGYPDDHTWFFNPLAWQFLFVIGAALGFARAGGRTAPPSGGPWLFIPAALAFTFAAVVCMSWNLHGVWESVPPLLLKALWPVNKTNLAPLRVLDFLAMAIVVGNLVTPHARFLRWRIAQPVIRCGQQSLQIFCLGILLSVLGHFILTEWSGGVAVQLAVNGGGIAAMIAMAALLGWYRKLDRAGVPATHGSPAPAVGGR